MDNTAKKPSKRSVVATMFVALCCFSSLLVVVFMIVGFGAFTPYLDYALYPALAIMIFAAFSAYKKWKNDCKTCVADNNDK